MAQVAEKRLVEVRTNTAAVERQSRFDQISMLAQPYLDDVELGLVLAKIKADIRFWMIRLRSFTLIRRYTSIYPRSTG